MYKKGKIVLVPFPFTDLSSNKIRPALILHGGSNKTLDVILAFITSKTDKDSGYSVYVKKGSDSFSVTGLKVDSTIRLDVLATLDKKIILGELGYIDSTLQESVDKQLKKLFEL